MKFTIIESPRKFKKYRAILSNGDFVDFGDARYAQYKDKTPLKLYSHLDHNDEARRSAYYKRHNKEYPAFSADYFSKRFLW